METIIKIIAIIVIGVITLLFTLFLGAIMSIAWVFGCAVTVKIDGIEKKYRWFTKL